jgi:hypothetical protein
MISVSNQFFLLHSNPLTNHTLRTCFSYVPYQRNSHAILLTLPRSTVRLDGESCIHARACCMKPGALCSPLCTLSARDENAYHACDFALPRNSTPTPEPHNKFSAWTVCVICRARTRSGKQNVLKILRCVCHTDQASLGTLNCRSDATIAATRCIR